MAAVKASKLVAVFYFHTEFISGFCKSNEDRSGLFPSRKLISYGLVIDVSLIPYIIIQKNNTFLLMTPGSPTSLLALRELTT